jgi:hypothetical protein
MRTDESTFCLQWLAPQHHYLVPKGDELEFERGAATKAEREQGNQRGKNDDHADDGTAAAR